MAQAQAPAPRLVVAYVETPPQKAAATLKRLDAYAAAEAKSAGGPAVVVLSEIGRPGRMAVLERWNSLAPATGSHADAALQAAVGQTAQTPSDRRPFIPATPFLQGSTPAKAFHVLMHVDVLPEGATTAAAALKAQAASVRAAPGALGFESGTQTDRPNHFAVHEIWASRAAYEAYTASPAGQDLRKKLFPFKGAPFDDRYYVQR